MIKYSNQLTVDSYWDFSITLMVPAKRRWCSEGNRRSNVALAMRHRLW